MKTSQALVLIAALATAGAASATVTATANLSDFQVSTFDLNRHDGVPGGITWADGSSNASIWLTDAVSGETASPYVWATGETQPLAVSGATMNGTGSASTSGGAMGSNVASVQGSMSGGNGLTSSFSAYASPYNWVGITIAPHTLVHFSANFDATAATTVGYVDGYPGEFANADATLDLWTGSGLSYMTNSSVVASYQANWNSDSGTWSYSGQSAEGHTVLDLFYVNNTDQAITGEFTSGVSVYGTSPFGATLPVPEPQSWSLLLLGLAATAGAVRRRASGKVVG